MGVDSLIPVVTAATSSYFPGVQALAGSFENAGPGFKLYCICYGDTLAQRCEALGVEPLDPVDWAAQYPASDVWKVGPAASYSRLNVPRMFAQHERVIWLDADAIIQRPLTHLATVGFDEPVACVDRAGQNFRLGFQVHGLPPELVDTPCTCNGLLVFNVAEWNRRRISEQCAAAMARDDLVFRYVDQSVLSYVLQGNWHRLDPAWLCFANRKKADVANARILVWAGGVPWRDPVPNRSIWERHAAKMGDAGALCNRS